MQALSCIKLKQLALTVIEHGIAQEEFVAPNQPDDPMLEPLTACFVTLYVDGELRGCTGSCINELPLWLAVCEYGYCSAFEDRRFLPIKEADLDKLELSISILSPLQLIKNNGEQQLIDTLQVDIDGLLITQNNRSAVFLPSVWSNLVTPERFLLELKRKGGWQDNYWAPDFNLYRFSVLSC